MAMPTPETTITTDRAILKNWILQVGTISASKAYKSLQA
jgi:hypothetical protein